MATSALAMVFKTVAVNVGGFIRSAITGSIRLFVGSAGSRIVSNLGTKVISTTIRGVTQKVGSKIVTTGGRKILSSPANLLKEGSKQAYYIQRFMHYGWRVVQIVQVIAFAIFTYLIVKNIGIILDFVVWLFTPFRFILYYIDRSFTSIRTVLRNSSGVDQDVDTIVTFKDFVMFIAVSLLDSVLIFVQEMFALVGAIFQSIIECARLATGKPWVYIILMIYMIIAYGFQHNYIDIMDTTNSFIVTTETATKQGFRMINVLLSVYDAMVPIKNVAFIHMVQRAVMLCGAFCPDEISFLQHKEARRILDSYPEYRAMDYYDRAVMHTSIDDARAARRGLQESTSLSRKIEVIRKAVMRVAFASFVMNQIELRFTAFFLILLKPFFDNIALAYEPIERFLNKIYCFTMGGIECTFRELVNFVAVLGVDFLNSFLGPIVIGYPSGVACGAERLSGVSAAECGGWLDSSKPRGACYSSLIQDPVIRSRKLDETEPQLDVLLEPLLECKQNPIDGSWVETLDGSVVHRSKVNKCPLSRQVFRDEFSNVKQFNAMNIDTECYTVCLHGVEYQSCHNQYTGHIRRLVGSCEEGLEINTEGQARRRLNSIFPDSFFGWEKIFGGSKITPNVTPYSGTYTDTIRGPSMNTGGPSQPVKSASLVDLLKKSLFETPKFVVYGMECELKFDLEFSQIFVNTVCVALKLYQDHGPSIEEMMSKYSGGGTSSSYAYGYAPNRRGRNLGDFVEDPIEYKAMQKSMETLKKWTSDFGTRKDELVGTVSQFRRYLRLLQSTDTNLEMDDRIDDLIDVANYRPSRRLLIEESPQFTTGENFSKLVVKDIGWCEGQDMYPCYSGECVPIQDRDKCTNPDLDNPNVGTLERINHYIHQASLIEIDPQEMFQEWGECLNQYSTNLDTVPVTYTNMQSGNGLFCTGVHPSFPYRLPDIEIKGINRLVSTGCTVNGINTCVCDFYKRTSVTYDALNVDFTESDVVVQFFNAGIAVHHILFVLILFNWPFIGIAWYHFVTAVAWFLAFIWVPNPPTELLFLFGDLGIHASLEKRWYCFFLHQGSLAYVLLVAVLTFDFIRSAGPIGYWWWCLMQRMSYYATVNKRYYDFFCLRARKASGRSKMGRTSKPIKESLPVAEPSKTVDIKKGVVIGKSAVPPPATTDMV